LQAISDNVSATPVNLRPIGNPARLAQTHGHTQIPAHVHAQPFLRRPPGAVVYSHTR